MKPRIARLLRRQAKELDVPYRWIKRAWATMTPEQRAKLRKESEETKLPPGWKSAPQTNTEPTTTVA